MTTDRKPPIQGWEQPVRTAPPPASAPPPGYLAVTERGVTRYIPRDDRPRQQQIVVPDLPNYAAAMPPTPTTSMTVLKTSYTDKAKGYSLVTLVLGGALGILGVLVAVVGFNVPALSLATLLTFWASFAVTWLIGWLAVVFVSGDGVALFTAWSSLGMVKKEQRVRLKFYEYQLRQLERDERTIDL